MFSLDRDKDTICAISTAPGVGGISIIRVSGDEASEVTRHLCAFLPDQLESHRAYFGTFKEAQTQKSIDEVLVTYFKKGRSYTGEETVEISCHGGGIVSQIVLNELVKQGCRLAQRGEFTYRAFTNGQIDLVQAESVLTLIESQSKNAARQALRQLKGELSSKLTDIEDRVINGMAQLEANIDFSMEDLQVASNEQVKGTFKWVLNAVEELIASYKVGRILNEGVYITLAGQPNVGKSSLLNLFIGDNKAIVTDIPGTTRDLNEGRAVVAGVQVNFVDTAGLRETEDKIEKIGIDRTKDSMENSDFIFYILDLSKEVSKEDLENLKNIEADKLVIIGNKRDLLNGPISDFKEKIINEITPFKEHKEVLEKLNALSSKRFLKTSAMADNGIESLTEFFKSIIEVQNDESNVVVSQLRHHDLLCKAKENFGRAIDLLDKDLSNEFILFELQEALVSIQELLGKQFDDQVMDRVFNQFCIGK